MKKDAFLQGSFFCALFITYIFLKNKYTPTIVDYCVFTICFGMLIFAICQKGFICSQGTVTQRSIKSFLVFASLALPYFLIFYPGLYKNSDNSFNNTMWRALLYGSCFYVLLLLFYN